MLKPNTWVKYMRHGEMCVGKYLGTNGLGFAVIEIQRSPFRIEVSHDDIIGPLHATGGAP